MKTTINDLPKLLKKVENTLNDCADHLNRKDTVIEVLESSLRYALNELQDWNPESETVKEIMDTLESEGIEL